MHLVPSFSGRTRGPAGVFFAAAIRPERASFSRRAADVSRPRRFRSAAERGTWNRFRHDGIIPLLRGFDAAPRDGEEKTMRQKSASARLPAFSRDGKPLRPFPPLPLSHAPFSPHKNFRSSVPLRGIRPEVTPKHAPCPQTHRPVLLQEADPGSPHYGTS